MKLWQKAACACALVLALVVAVCAAAMTLYARHTILDISRRQVMDKQRDLAASFSEMAGYYRESTDSAPVRDSLILYCFARFADEEAVLMHDGETLSSALNIDPSDWLEAEDAGSTAWVMDGSQRTYEGRIRGRNVFMAASMVSVRSERYAVYVVQDVTGIHRSLTVMALIFLGVSLIGIAAGTGAVTLLMRRGARPLAALSAASRRIAGGEYAVRADVSTRDEIGALAADFNTMAAAVQARVDELTETAQRQKLFIGGVTHEFKTPLTAILLHTRLLQKVNLTEEEKRQSLGHIERQCTWLERLVQKLLRTITLDQDVVKESLPARELAERVRESTEQIMAGRDVTLHISCDGSVLLADPDLMQSLVVNLVDNAGKSYDPDSPDRAVWLTVTDGVIEVLDHGRGIPAGALERVFEPFYMVDKSRSKKAGGSGLGLALVKQIADAHGAKLEVTSAPDQGTAVRVLLPR